MNDELKNYWINRLRREGQYAVIPGKHVVRYDTSFNYASYEHEMLQRLSVKPLAGDFDYLYLCGMARDVVYPVYECAGLMFIAYFTSLEDAEFFQAEWQSDFPVIS